MKQTYYYIEKSKGSPYKRVLVDNEEELTSLISKGDITPRSKPALYNTEAKMFFVLTEHFNKVDSQPPFKYDPTNNRKRYIPDFICDDKYVIEFDGFQHYTTTDRVLKDIDKNIYLESLGYTVIRIPYFIQVDSAIKHIKDFNTTSSLDISYPNGFIDELAVLPIDYCHLGFNRFVDDLKKFNKYSTNIIDTVYMKIINRYPNMKHLDIVELISRGDNYVKQLITSNPLDNQSNCIYL